MPLETLTGAGIGLRRALLPAFKEHPNLEPVQFMEIAPENWINLGGKNRRDFYRFAEQFPIIMHGLSLSIGGPDELNIALVQAIKQFKQSFHCPLYSEHLSYCTDGGQLYDLMPIPFTEAAALHVIERVNKVQDILGERMALENVSYYTSQPGSEMTELEFITQVITQADCHLHLDVSNVYVNGVNHGYNAKNFIESLPSERIVYGHIAGHDRKSEDLIIDTHGADVIDPVWELLEYSYQCHGVFPTLLERDFDFPALEFLLAEVKQIDAIQAKFQSPHDKQSQL